MGINLIVRRAKRMRARGRGLKRWRSTSFHPNPSSPHQREWRGWCRRYWTRRRWGRWQWKRPFWLRIAMLKGASTGCEIPERELHQRIRWRFYRSWRQWLMSKDQLVNRTCTETPSYCPSNAKELTSRRPGADDVKPIRVKPMRAQSLNLPRQLAAAGWIQ